MNSSYIHINRPKCLLLLTEEEIFTLLKTDHELWKKSLQRGKIYKRTIKQKDREQKKYMDESQEETWLINTEDM